MKIQHKKASKVIWIIVVSAVIIVGLCGYGVYAWRTGAWPFPTTSRTDSPADISLPVSETPDGQDPAVSDPTYGGSKNGQSDDGQTAPTTDKKAVGVSVTSADVVDDMIEVRAYVDGIIEGNGTCTATLTKSDGTTITGTSEAFVNATNTQCRPIRIARSTGTWSVVVSYSSPDSQGTSPALTRTFQ